MTLFHKGEGSFDPGDMETLVGPEAYFQGAMTVRGSIRVEGRVEGDILEAQTVVIGPNGKVRGNVCAERVVVGGQVAGDVVAASILEIKATGRVTGNLRTPRLLIEEGASFDGSCSMSEGGKSSAAPDLDPERVAEKA
ncbi:MAG: polymer-forming cytoskeletal protein [Elusimicrobia bacterium]|nr:polymer-forming cytoskeletal protein [Elusimicrobiota bacterium]